MQLLFAVLAAAAGRRPSGRGALASVQLPRAVARHRAILLAWQPPVVSMATEGGMGIRRAGQLMSLLYTNRASPHS